MASSQDVGRSLRSFQNDMPSSLQGVLFCVLAVISVALGTLLGQWEPAIGIVTAAAGIVVSFFVASAVKVANQWQRGVVLRLGKFQGIRGPGFFVIVPVVDRVRMIDTRVLTCHVRQQEAITRDNVPVTIDSVLFYRVVNAEDAVMKIQDYAMAIGQLAQVALRDAVGGTTLDELLAEREQFARQMEQHVEADSREWGLHVTSIRLQDVDMPEELKKIMLRQAGAEREKRATITKAEGDKLAAENLAAAATIMGGSPGAMQLRTLQTIDGLGPGASNTVIPAVPIEIMQLVKKLSQAS